MQIRNQHGKIQLIRTTYDPTIKRGRSVLVGTLPSYASAIPIALNEKLTDVERAQLQPILDKNMAELDTYRQMSATRNLPETIRNATRWYLQNGKADANLSTLAEESRVEFAALLSAMVKVGVGRKRKRKPS